MKHKSDVFDRFKEFAKLIKNKFGRPIKVLRSDNGLEYCNQNINNYLSANGIKKENTAPYTPQQNGKTERDNRTIVECARTMIHAKNLSLCLWAEAVNTAVYVLNRTVSPNNGVTPYEMWAGKRPSVEYLRIFGSKAFVHVPNQLTKKFDVRAQEMILVGYQGDSKNYRVYNPASRQVTVTRNATCNEITGRAMSNQKENEDGELMNLRRNTKV